MRLIPVDRHVEGPIVCHQLLAELAVDLLRGLHPVPVEQDAPIPVHQGQDAPQPEDRPLLRQPVGARGVQVRLESLPQILRSGRVSLLDVTDSQQVLELGRIVQHRRECVANICDHRRALRQPEAAVGVHRHQVHWERDAPLHVPRDEHRSVLGDCQRGVRLRQEQRDHVPGRLGVCLQQRRGPRLPRLEHAVTLSRPVHMPRARNLLIPDLLQVAPQCGSQLALPVLHGERDHRRVAGQHPQALLPELQLSSRIGVATGEAGHVHTHEVARGDLVVQLGRRVPSVVRVQRRLRDLTGA